MPQLEGFAYPFMYWVGMATDPRTTPEALAEFNRFYSTTHVHEVVRGHPGFVSASRYELVDPHPAGGPRWLAVYGMADETAALRYLKDNERPWLHRQRYSQWPSARKKARTVWRMLWRQISVTGSPDQADVVMVGTNVPVDGGGTRLELYREFAHPAPGCPRFCTIYDAPSSEPTPAEQDDPVWRLVYRRIPPPE